MAINKKLLHFVSKANFSTQLANSNIDSKSIVFIKDTGEIWTHDKLYSCASWGTNQTNYVPLTIGGTSYNLSKDGHTHNYLPLSGGTLTGSISVAGSITNLSNTGGGIFWNPYAESISDGSDAASISVATSGGSTVMSIKQMNDANDYINFLVNSNANGVRINGNAIYHAGNIPTWNQNTTGNAGTATNLSNIPTTFTGTYPLTVNVSGTIYSHTGMTFNGTTGNLTATSFTGSLNGNATTVTNGVYTNTVQTISAKKTMYSTDSTGTYGTRALELREVGLTTTTNSADANYSPAIGFHWGGITQAILAMRSDGNFYFVRNNSASEAYAYITTAGFKRAGSSDSYVLLGGGGHALLSSLSNSHTHGLINSNFTVTVANTTTNSGWSMLNAPYGGFLLKSIRTEVSAPSWLLGNFASGIVFGGSDTKGVISVAYNSPAIRVAGGNGSTPVWYVDLIHSSNISSQSVNYATSSGNSDTVDNQHFSYTNTSDSPTWLWASNSSGTNFLANRANISVNYANYSTKLQVIDNRGTDVLPNSYSDYRVTPFFNDLTGVGTWASGITVAGWTAGYSRWQILGYSDTGANDNLYFRSQTNGGTNTWNTLRTILHSGNYTAYSPSLTGSGASGTWGISITGNAGSVDGQNFTYSNSSNSPTYLWATDSSGSSYLAARESISVNYANSAGTSATATYLPTKYNGGVQSNPQVYFGQSTGLRVAMTGVAGTWSDTLWINGYSGGDVLSMCALHTSRQGTPRMWITSQGSNSTTYGTLYEFVSTYNYSSLLDGRYRPLGGVWSGNGVPGTREFGWVTNDASGEVAFKSYNNTMNMIIDGNIYVTDNSYLVWHAGNFTPGNYLPLSGGTMTGDVYLNSNKLRYQNNSVYLEADGLGGALVHSNQAGYIRIGPLNSAYAHIYTDRPQFYFNKDLLVNNNIVWHSGNDGSGSGLDADTLDGVHNGNVTANYFKRQTTSLDANNPSSPYMWFYGQPEGNRSNWASGEYGGIFTTLNEAVDLNAQFNWSINHDSETPTNSLFFRASNNRGFKNDWKQIAFTTSNVESANRLKTPRSIWGQSFDGAGDVSGNLSNVHHITSSGYYYSTISGVARTVIDYHSGGVPIFGYGTARAGLDTHLDGNNIRFYAASSRIEVMNILSSGNVLIGTTTDAGYKLDVNGTLRATGAVTLDSTLSVNNITNFHNAVNLNGSSINVISPNTTGGWARGMFFSTYANPSTTIGGVGAFGSSSNFESVYFGAGPSPWAYGSLRISTSRADIDLPLYGASFITANRFYAGYDSGVPNSINCSGWFRSNGPTGWYNATYGGGITMLDSTYVVVTNDKAFKVTNTASDSIRTLGGISANGGVTAVRVDSTLGYYKSGSSNDYVLLGGGGSKSISDFRLKSEKVLRMLFRGYFKWSGTNSSPSEYNVVYSDFCTSYSISRVSTGRYRITFTGLKTTSNIATDTTLQIFGAGRNINSNDGNPCYVAISYTDTNYFDIIIADDNTTNDSPSFTLYINQML